MKPEFEDGVSHFKPWNSRDQKINPTIPRPPLFRAAFLQVCLALMLCGLCWPFDKNVAGSFLAGATAHVIPQAYFALRGYRYVGATHIRETLKTVKQSLFAKLILTACIFAVVFRLWPQVNLAVLFGSFIFFQLTTWFMYSLLINRPVKRRVN